MTQDRARLTVSVAEIDIGQLVTAYDRAVEKHHTGLTDEQKKLHNEALGERFSEIDSLGIEPEIRDAIVTKSLTVHR